MQAVSPTKPPAPSAPAIVSSASLRGRRLALCVGIDNYPTAPLGGCVNDAQLWQDTLRHLGFDVALLRNEQARRDGLAAALEAHFLQARDGDELVLQFAGHGTQAPDLNGDEDGGDSPGLDEALCPQDYAEGPLLLDDDLGAWIDRIAPGVRLTLFMDCCHSGDNSRVARTSAVSLTSGARSRGVSLSPGQRSAFVDWHARTASSRRAARKASAALQRATAAKGAIEAAFSACHSRELAWESQGQGEFTLRATQLLKNGGARLTPDEFYRRVVDDFGAQRRQTPQMKAPADRLAQPLFLL
jgi:Caspase domain